MAMKSKAKPQQQPKATVKAKVTIRSKAAVKAKPAGKLTSKPKAKAKILKKTIAKPGVKSSSVREPKTKSQVNVAAPMVNGAAKTSTSAKTSASAKSVTPVVKRTLIPLVDRHKPMKRSTRVNQFAFMKAPELDNGFDVGDTVEVFCDHEKSRERIRGWIKGIVVQVDNKMAAVQFRSNVYLTDGWMVPDRILWYPLTSENIRAVPGKKPVAKKDFIPDY